MKYFRYVYVIANALVAIFFGLYLTEQYEQSLNDVKKELLTKNEIIAAGSRTSLFGQEALMLQVGSALMDVDALRHPERGKHFITNIREGHLKIHGYALSRTDGQIVLMSTVPLGEKMPNLLTRQQSAESFQRALDKPGLQLAPPYPDDYDGDGIYHWIIPARLAIRNEAGAPVAVLSTALGITTDGTIWNQLSERHKTNRKSRQRTQASDFSEDLHGYSSVSFVVQGDGYIQYAGCGLSNPGQLSQIFSGTVSDKLMHNLRERHKNSAISIWHSHDLNKYVCHADNQEYITASEYISEFDIYVLTALRLTTWEIAFFKSIIPQLLTYLLLLAITYVSYRYTTRLLRNYEKRVTYLARYDALTGLPNKDQLIERTQTLVAVANRGDYLCALLIINIANLPLINQTRGLKFGQKATQSIAEAYKGCIREGDVLARIDGETFAIFLPTIKNEQEVLKAVERVQAILKTPLKINGGETFMIGKIGFAVYPTDARNGEELLNAATLACDIAKKEHTLSILRYTPQIDTGASRHAKLAYELARGVENGEIEAYYQPKVCAQTGKCNHFEALARWHSISFGMVSPDEFIAIAEEIGLIDQLSMSILDIALKDMKRLQEATGQITHVAINISAKQFLNPNLPQDIESALNKHNFPGKRLTVELTESLMIIDKEQVANMLAAMRKMGIGISIDDFGTGYSSLSYIHKLPVTELKIDRSFITDITRDASNKTLVQSIIALGKSLQVQLVAEGVEIIEHVEILKEFGCHHLQGYYYSPPRPIEDIIHYIQKH